MIVQPNPAVWIAARDDDAHRLPYVKWGTTKYFQRQPYVTVPMFNAG